MGDEGNGLGAWPWQKQLSSPPRRPVSDLPFALRVQCQRLNDLNRQLAAGEGPGCLGGKTRHF